MISLTQKETRTLAQWKGTFLLLVICMSVPFFLVFRESSCTENMHSGNVLKKGPNSTYSVPHVFSPTDDEQNLAVPIRRWNATQLNYILQSNASLLKVFSVHELLHLVPKPSGDDVQIYNIKAWNRLRTLLTDISTTSNHNRTVRLCSVGGSSTAGGGGVHANHRWDAKYIEMLQTTNISSNPVRSLQVINRGHGSRGSVHAAFVMHSIVPADVDILVWEFSINDGHEKGCQEVNNGIIIWLNQIQRMWPKNPPLVILTYLWNPSVSGADEVIHQDTVFRCHDHLAAAYDFVVGSVHLGSYIRNLQHGLDFLRLFLSDAHHPNRWGHWFLGYLLWDLTTNTSRRPMNYTNNVYNNDGVTRQPNWTCDVVPREKKRVKELLDTELAFASWTAEVPRNEENGDFNQGMLSSYISYLHNTTFINRNISFVALGKSSEFRMDRKRATVLPCCTTQERVYFDLDMVREQCISAIQVYAPDFTTTETLSRSISVDLSYADGTTHQSLQQTWVTFEPHECRVGHWFLNTWLVLSEPQCGVSQLIFCDANPNCGHESTRPASVLHVVLY